MFSKISKDSETMTIIPKYKLMETLVNGFTIIRKPRIKLIVEIPKLDSHMLLALS